MRLDPQESRFRMISSNERKLLDAMLSVRFAGADVLREQLNGLLVGPIDEIGEMRLMPAATSRPASVEYRVPVEATYRDSDGEPVHVFLHVVDGLLHELELVREDLGAIQRPPADAETLLVEPRPPLDSIR